MGKVLDWDNRRFFPLYKQFTLFYLTNLYSAKKKKPHMFNVECSKLYDRGSLKFFSGVLLNGYLGGFVFFFRWTSRKGGWIFLGGCDLHRNCGMVAILLSFLYNYDNLTLKLQHGKRSYPDEGWLFIGRFKARSVPGISIALKASKKSIKIHDEYDARPLIKSYNCY